MIRSDEVPFGDGFYEQQQRLWGYDSKGYGYDVPTRKQYLEVRDVALADSEFDFFEHYLPTGRSKHDIGYYALRNGVTVPLITSLQDLRDAAEEGNILVRSDGEGEYDGPSGLRRTHHIGRVSPGGRHHYAWATPPDEEELTLGIFNGVVNSLANVTSDPAMADLNRLATAQILSGNMYPGAQLGMRPGNSSLWHRILGDNISVMRDPVQEDLYHFRWGDYVSAKIRRDAYDEGYPVFRHGDGTAKHWQRTLDGGGGVSDGWFGSFIPHESARYHGLSDEPIEGEWKTESGKWIPMPSGLPEFWAPVQEMIGMYEKVRTLPLFDQRQVPVMEMQYNRDQKKLHFLQYLKTGRVLEHLNAFTLPSGPQVATGVDVVGATGPEGEKMRIHVGVTTENFKRAEAIVRDEGVLLPLEMILGGGGYLQSLALMARAAFIDYRLTFHNHHFGSAMFTRTPLSIGLMDWRGEIGERLITAHTQYLRDNPDGSVGYVNAVVTSNGREVAVESDWQPRRTDEE